MSKLRFRIVLPILQLLLAVVLLTWGRHMPQPPGLDFPYSPTMVLVCNGINAPANLLPLMLYPLLRLEGRGGELVSIFGFGEKDISFLIGVVLLWYFVGLSIDRHARQRMSSRPAGAARALIDTMLMLLGAALLFIGVTPFLWKRGFTNLAGASIAGVLYVIWSLVLFFMSGIDYLSWFRARLRRP